MNKKGVDFNAGLGIVIIIVYFILFGLITTSVNSFGNDIDSDLSQNSQYSYLSNNLQEVSVSYCNSPRKIYNEDGTYKESTPSLFNSNLRSLKCSESNGVFGQTQCNSISGCSWSTRVCKWYDYNCNSSSKSCNGYINSDNYGVASIIYNGETMVATYDYENIQSVVIKGIVDFMQWSSDNSANVCTHPEVLGNEELCSLFSCTWQTESSFSGNVVTSGRVIVKLTKNVFNFVSPFDFKEKDGVTPNSNLNLIMSLIFVFIPLLLLIIFIYMALPFI